MTENDKARADRLEARVVAERAKRREITDADRAFAYCAGRELGIRDCLTSISLLLETDPHIELSVLVDDLKQLLANVIATKERQVEVQNRARGV